MLERARKKHVINLIDLFHRKSIRKAFAYHSLRTPVLESTDILAQSTLSPLLPSHSNTYASTIVHEYCVRESL